MFFGPSYEDFDNLQKTQAINTSALVLLLVEKGIIKAEEFERAHVQATAAIDQQFEKRKREAMAEFASDHPALSRILKGINEEHAKPDAPHEE